MSSRDPTIWMWAEACQYLERAERLHRRFFEPGQTGEMTVWEPPVDLFETTEEVIVEIALPGVEPQRVTATVEGRMLIVSGERTLPRAARSASIRRLELPYGRFERRIALAPGRYELGRRELVNGCLSLVLRKTP